MNVPSGEDLARWLLPLDEYRAIRDDMIDIYIAAYEVYPATNRSFTNLSISEMQDVAGQNAVAALNYDPTDTLNEIQRAYSRMVKWIITTLALVFLVGVGIGSVTAITFSRSALQLVTTASGLLVSAVIGGSTLVSVAAGFILVYVGLLSASSTIIGALNEELVYGPRHFKTRSHTRLVGRTVWNSSLDGSGGIKLLLIFGSLKVLSAIPGWNPYRIIKIRVMQNMDLFIEADGFVDAWKMGFGRLWKKRKERLAKSRELRGS